MIALLDGDIYCYRIGFTTESEPESIAASRIDEMIKTTLQEVNACTHQLYLTGKGNFRREVNPLYKANRTKPKPIHLPFLVNHLVTNWNAVLVEGMEADDYLAINQSDDSIICSIDKDLLTVPGKHYNFVKKEFKEVSYIEGLKAFYKQFIIGDTSDNIIGIAGMGPKRASSIIDSLNTEQEMFNAVRMHYNDDERMLMNGVCLHMKRTLTDDWSVKFESLKGVD